MKKVERPTEDVADIIEICASNMPRRADLASRLRTVSPVISAESHNYERLGDTYSLFTFPECDSVRGGAVVTNAEMKNIYRDFSSEGSDTRGIYDRLLLAAKNKICPMCNQRGASQLDHFLPKSKFSLFTITPVNLVPICPECNHAKGAIARKVPSRQFFHPYFDDFDDEEWLEARVIEADKVAIVFRPVPPVSWDPVKKWRACHHFSKLNLGALYASQAGSALSKKSPVFRNLVETGGESNLREYLDGEAEGLTEGDKNSWEAALYRALSTSDWFCEEGFEKID